MTDYLLRNPIGQATLLMPGHAMNVELISEDSHEGFWAWAICADRPLALPLTIVGCDGRAHEVTQIHCMSVNARSESKAGPFWIYSLISQREVLKPTDWTKEGF